MTFYETTSDKLDSLPIVEGRFTFTKDGKFYLDARNASDTIERFSINEDKVFYDTTANWNAQTDLIGEKGKLYIYSDYQTSESGDVIPGIKIGVGLSYLIDNPFIDELMIEHIQNSSIHITDEEREAWNNKVSCSIDSENSVLVFTTT